MQTAETAGPVESVPGELLVLCHPADEPVPRGRLGRADWLCCGALTRLRARGKFRGERGAVALLSTDGKLLADRLLVLGLGGRVDLTVHSLYRLSYQLAQAVLALRCERIAVEPPVRLFPAHPPERIRQAFLEGFLAELRRGRPGAAFAVTVLV
ncbi:MAG TPA: M17 family peptidase N-terminal domain-containing protein [Candidatus Sulfotelmatobacter sp.]|nr:M17 family peptidase N-terminal domain-containing protein [Candidatus Sulfotelmatobacter sp.]